MAANEDLEVSKENPFERGVANTEANNAKMFFSPLWIKDEDVTKCTKCSLEFNFLNRKHHCRACGRIFCNQCCRRWLLLPQDMFEFRDPQRTCEECFVKFSSIDFSRTFDVYGPETAPTIIILHGEMFNRMVHKHQVDIWSKKYRVITTDLPGHGSRMLEKFTLEEAVRELRDLISEQVPDGKALLFGWSVGAYVALVFANQYPEAVHGLILGSAVQKYEESTKFFGAAVGAFFAALPNSLLWTVLPTRYPQVPRTTFDDLVFRSGLFYESYMDSVVAVVSYKSDYYELLLKEFKGPIMFVHGEKDVRDGEAMYLKAAKDSKIHLIKGGSGIAFMEPEIGDEMSEIIAAFADRIDWNN